MTSGIYAIKNVTDDKVYIGRSVNIEKRWHHHKWQLDSDRHGNPHLQRSWNRGDKFEFLIIEECGKDLLNDREIYWIARYKSTDTKYGYNLCEGGKSTTGRVCSEETRKKISERNKGRKCTKETVERRVQTFKKHMEDPEYRENHIKKLSDIGKKRGTPWNIGKSKSEETKQKLSVALKGRKKPKSQGEKLRALWSGENGLCAKLKERDVVQIRLRFLNGERQCSIRRDYPNITPQTMYDICRYRRWKSVPNTIDELEEMERNYEHSRDWQQAD